MSTILWFRQDLRLADNPALVAALKDDDIIPVYVLDDSSPGDRAMGGASRWWLHHSLVALDADLQALGSRLILRRGECVSVLHSIMAQTGANAIHANRQYEPWWRRADAELAVDVNLVLHDGNQLAPPASILSGIGTRYKVFTPWWKMLQTQMPPPAPLPKPDAITTPACDSDDVNDWHLLPTKPDWSGGFGDWTPGETGARAAVNAFMPALADYDHARNLPSTEGVSRLSPHLHFGEVSPSAIWHHAAKRGHDAAEPFLREIGWRDYAANLIDQFPDYDRQNGRRMFDVLPWRDGAKADADFDAWTKGRTGYPIVDAGMRQLWATGWMHNRVRMIAASFLIKHLLIDWRRGERWFWDTLVDADHASNASNWQWVAGTGVDAPMMSRIMAPLSQSEKFGAGKYIRRWVPELAKVSDPYVHDPDEFGVRPRDYPAKLIGHRDARERALAAMKGAKPAD